MAITVAASPTILSTSNYAITPPPLIDPSDGASIDAFTRFNFSIPDLPPRTVQGKLALADSLVIAITPNAQVALGVTLTASLLAHEQFHYDVGVVTGRALARELMALRAADVPSLHTAMIDSVRLHFTIRAGLLQRRYDLDSRHGTNAHYQAVWKNRMTACLAKPGSEELGGFRL